MIRSRFLRLPVALASIGAFAWSMTATPAARADSSLIGWTTSADANPFDFVVDNSAGLSGVHPVTEADIPEASSDYETGPFGHGLASIVWPGGTLGNFGSLSEQLGLPSQIEPLFAKANDPVRAETFYPAGPKDSTYPAGSTSSVFEMRSHADANGTWAKSALSDATLSSLFEVQGVRGASTTGATNTAKATANGGFSSLSILGGMITIGSTTSSATAQSDGISPTGSASTHIGAVTIAGHQVSVGNDGIVVGPASTNILGVSLAPSVDQVNQLIAALHLKITPLPLEETRKAPVETITSAGLRITMALPSDASLSLDCSALPPQLSQLSVLCTLPGELQGASVSMTVARATATAIATPPFTCGPPLCGGTGGSVSTPPLPSPGNSGGGTAGVGTSIGSGGGSGASGGVPVSTSSGPSIAGGSVGSSQPATTGPSASGGGLAAAAPASLSRPVKAGLLMFLLVLAGIAAAGIIRAGRHLDDPPPADICPLTEEIQ